MMPSSSATIPPPRIKELLAPDAELRQALLPIWLAAQDDPDAYPILKTGFVKGRLDVIYRHTDLARRVRRLQPPDVNTNAASSYLSWTMFASTIPFISAAVLTVGETIFKATSRSRFADVHTQLQRVTDAIFLILSQYSQPMDAYTLDVLEGIWRLACSHPSALQEHAPGSLAVAEHVGYPHPLVNHHRSLAWSIWKLQMNGVHRLQQSNTCPVMDLPMELLSEVFMHLKGVYPRYERSRNHDHWNISCHLAVREVCRRWRDTVDRLPKLWAPMVLDFGLRMTERALLLSKSESLDVHISNSTRWSAAHLLVFEHLPRIRTIDISSQAWDVYEQLPALLRAFSAPRLSSFTLFPFLDLEGQRRIVLPPDIFQATPPEDLRAVNLADCTIILPSPLLTPTLVVLRLSGCHVWADLDSLLDSLLLLPALQVFTWRVGLDNMSNTDPATHLPDTMYQTPTREPVTLSHMQQLELECPTSCAAALMARLVIPPSCRVDLADDYTLTGVLNQDRDVRADLLASLETALDGHLHRIFALVPNTGYETILIEQHPETEPGRGAFYIQGRVNDDTHPRCSIALLVAGQRGGSIDEETVAFLLRGILSWPAINTATFFETNHELFASAALWTAVLDYLPRICYVCINNNGQSDASGAITGLSQALRAAPHAMRAFSHIHLKYMSFPSSQQERLAEIAKDRFAAGHPVLTLYVDDCEDFDPDTLQDVLRAHGGDAIFIGKSPVCCRPRVTLNRDE
ncbi:hypothetical protein PENSPDRAFT_695132 [Peniophora sp. CONT]|nr:hypothetical protein PENSPDRAFT_695132 [Peniophora sp. CONT]